MLSGSGGECTLVSDAAANVGIEVPELTETTKAQLQESVADFGNMNNPLDGTGAMYDDDKIFPRLLQALIDDANIDVVTINLEANDPRPKELKSGNRFSAAIEKAAASSPKPIVCFQLGCRRPSGSGDSVAACAKPVCRSWKAPSAPPPPSEI